MPSSTTPGAKPVSLARELTLALYRTDQVLTAALERVLKPTDLRLDEFNVLRILRGGGPEGYVRADIEQRMLHDPDRLLALLHRLKSRGLVEGTIRVSITEAGKELLKGIDPAFEAEIERCVGHVPHDKLRVAIEVLQAVRERTAG
jgi:DNA-binding MarR family transcriptional regulator